MSHIKGGRRLGEIAEGRQDARENLREVEDFHFKGCRRLSLIREERGAGLFEIIREAGGRQMILREEGG